MSITYMNNIVEETIRQYYEYKEKEFAEIITKYDFIVGSEELKNRLVDILPDGANIIYSKYMPNPTMCYAIKKFDIMELVKEPLLVEREDKE